MICPVCKGDFKNPFETYSIEHLKRCVDCQKKWISQPENDPDNKEFEINWTNSGTTTIYAKDSEEAAEKFKEDYCGDFDDYEVEEVKRSKNEAN